MSAIEAGRPVPPRVIPRPRFWSHRDRPRVVFSAFPPGSIEQRLWVGTTARIAEGIDEDVDLPLATAAVDPQALPLVIWRIATNGFIELAVSAAAYPDLLTAQEDVHAVLGAADDMVTEFVTGANGHHAWRTRLDGETTLVARRWYPARADCEQSAASVADALRELPVDEDVDTAFDHFRVKRLDAMRADAEHGGSSLGAGSATRPGPHR